MLRPSALRPGTLRRTWPILLGEGRNGHISARLPEQLLEFSERGFPVAIKRPPARVQQPPETGVALVMHGGKTIDGALEQFRRLSVFGDVNEENRLARVTVPEFVVHFHRTAKRIARFGVLVCASSASASLIRTASKSEWPAGSRRSAVCSDCTPSARMGESAKANALFLPTLGRNRESDRVSRRVRATRSRSARPSSAQIRRP